MLRQYAQDLWQPIIQIGSPPPVGRRSPGSVAAHTRGGGEGDKGT
ncbi:MAG: hypothetical protein ACR2LR_02605 [Hassallia sp.]